MKKILIIILSLGFGLCIYGKSVPSPNIHIMSPVDNTWTSHDKILIKGSTVGIESLQINNIVVPIETNGDFFFRYELNHPQHNYILKVSGQDKSGNLITSSRKIYKVDKAQEVKRLQSAFDAIHTAYQGLGWKQSKLKDDIRHLLIRELTLKLKQDGTIASTNDLIEIAQIQTMINSLEVLRREGSLMFAMPWTGSKKFLEPLTAHIFDIVDTLAYSNLKRFGVLWFNRDLSILEIYGMKKTGQMPLVPKFWLLDDLMFNYKDNSSRTYTLYKGFISNRFVFNETDPNDIIRQEKADVKQAIANLKNRVASGNITNSTSLTATPTNSFLVITGSFLKKKNAKKQLRKLSRQRYKPKLYPYNSADNILYYRNQVGPYDTYEQAAKIEKFLISDGYETMVIQE